MGDRRSGVSFVIYLVIFIMYSVSMELCEAAGGGEESLALHSAPHINITRAPVQAAQVPSNWSRNTAYIPGTQRPAALVRLLVCWVTALTGRQREGRGLVPYGASSQLVEEENQLEKMGKEKSGREKGKKAE
ncbi:hypothetical protein E2C01_023766 [Portunus trituberculatus]|uniref:Uncharacterized protein n=1 Tax=Portunus trituberculatus TaxID=210409 RepID=A0A5B7EAX0_PORTR|nr:hypothetical protein [Portunus trituberculatus]